MELIEIRGDLSRSQLTLTVGKNAPPKIIGVKRKSTFFSSFIIAEGFFESEKIETNGSSYLIVNQRKFEIVKRSGLFLQPLDVNPHVLSDSTITHIEFYWKYQGSLWWATTTCVVKGLSEDLHISMVVKRYFGIFESLILRAEVSRIDAHQTGLVVGAAIYAWLHDYYVRLT